MLLATVLAFELKIFLCWMCYPPVVPQLVSSVKGQITDGTLCIVAFALVHILDVQSQILRVIEPLPTLITIEWADGVIIIVLFFRNMHP